MSREAQSASALEGTVVPLEDVLGVDDEGEVQASDRDLLEVVNYRFAAKAMVLYQFETLRPFNDGNGRIGTLLVVLQPMSATGDWDPWVWFFARGVSESVRDSVARVNRLLAVRDESMRLVMERNPKSSTMRSIAERMVSEPF